MLFAVEVLIALYMHDRFVRPYLGDVLAVILVYCGLRAVLRIGVVPGAAAALAIGFLVEFGQLIGILDMLGLRDDRIASVVLGSGFEVKDLFAYTVGAATVLLVERIRPPSATR